LLNEIIVSNLPLTVVTQILNIITGKKLKKRLEDLEKRAYSHSASPEQKPASLPKQKSTKKRNSVGSKSTDSVESSQTSSEYTQSILTAEPTQVGFLSMSEDRLFSEPYSRHLSRSPPMPASYPMVSAEMFNYPAFSSQSPFSATAAGCNDSSIYAYQTPFTSPYPSPLSTIDYPVKQDLFSEVDLNFNLGFPSMSSVELSQTLAFADQLPQVNHPFHQSQ